MLRVVVGQVHLPEVEDDPAGGTRLAVRALPQAVVGTEGLAAVLLRTDAGAVLIDGVDAAARAVRVLEAAQLRKRPRR